MKSHHRSGNFGAGEEEYRAKLYNLVRMFPFLFPLMSTALGLIACVDYGEVCFPLVHFQ